MALSKNKSFSNHLLILLGCLTKSADKSFPKTKSKKATNDHLVFALFHLPFFCEEEHWKKYDDIMDCNKHSVFLSL